MVDFIPTIAESIQNLFTGWIQNRWWIDPRILIGGSIHSPMDFEHLRSTYGITHVLSVESERSDWGKVLLERLCYLPTADDGSAQHPLMLQKAAEFGAEVLEINNNKLLIHCQQGASRSPTYGYAVLRKVYGIDRDEYLRRVRHIMPEWGKHPFHPVYMNSVEDAITYAGVAQ